METISPVETRDQPTLIYSSPPPCVHPHFPAYETPDFFKATCDGGYVTLAASEWTAEDAWLDGDQAFYEKAERIKLEAGVLREQVCVCMRARNAGGCIYRMKRIIVLHLLDYTTLMTVVSGTLTKCFLVSVSAIHGHRSARRIYLSW